MLFRCLIAGKEGIGLALSLASALSSLGGRTCTHHKQAGALPLSQDSKHPPISTYRLKLVRTRRRSRQTGHSPFSSNPVSKHTAIFIYFRKCILFRLNCEFPKQTISILHHLAHSPTSSTTSSIYHPKILSRNLLGVDPRHQNAYSLCRLFSVSCSISIQS